MKTLFEEVLRSDAVIPAMVDAEVIYIQNVANYLMSLTDDYVNVVSNIPNIAPPFPCFWMEYKIPDLLYDGERMRKNDTMPNVKVGFLFTSKEKDGGWQTNILMFAKDMFAVFDENFIGIRQWFSWVVDINKDGTFTRDFGVRLSDKFNMTPEDKMASEMEWDGHVYAYLSAVLLAIAFLHCKNVDFITHEPRVTGTRRARNQSKIKFHTLQIEPMKKVLREEGRAEETGIKHALHICRGHFKDFSKGKGLFGKYRDVFWWESQVRGSGEYGAVVKDYSINEPQG